VLDSAGQHVALHRSHCVLLAGDHQHLCPAQHDPELFVLMAVERNGRPRLELDQVQHRALAEERPADDADGELELADVVEVDELRFHAAIVRWTTMHHREEYRVEGLAEPISHYTDAVRTGNLLFISGIVPVDGQGKLVGEGDVAEQTRQIFRNIELVLKAAGCGFEDVVKVTAFLLNVDDRPAINPVRMEFFGEARPASTLVEVSALAVPGALLEIEAVAAIPH
jgi:2-iminobutanoate/2-iminopropanoate deaminase